MSASLAKRVRRRLKKVWYSHVLSCFCVNQKNPNNSGETFERTGGKSLQILLVKTLQNQAEDREFRVQLQSTLLYLTTILEGFSKTYVLGEHFPKSTTVVAPNSFNQSISNFKSNSLVIPDGQESLLPTQISEIFANGGFGSHVLYRVSKDKAIQSTKGYPSITSSKLIQTHLGSLPGFDVTGFKVNMIKHMRCLKQDVVTLKQLLFSVESCYSWGCKHGALWREDQLDYKFFEAKVRAANFVKFYKLRKIGDRKDKRLARKSRNV